MLTKREYCESIVQEEMSILNIKERKDAHAYIFQSSKLAVALEYLGELSPSEKEYSSSRAGIVTRNIELDEDGSLNDIHFLTVREMIDLLPTFVYRNEMEED